MRFGLPALVPFALLSAQCSPATVGSVGAVFGRDNETHTLYVREVPPGLAADTAGLLPGDQVLMIDGYYVRDLEGHEIRRRLRGEVGTEVSLTIARGEEIRHMRVVRTPLRERKELQPREERIGP